MSLRVLVGLIRHEREKSDSQDGHVPDGFVTSPDGTHDWMFEFFGDDSGEWSRRLDEAGVHAMGRCSYEIMGPHWAASEGPIATAMNEKPKAVFSHTLKDAVGGLPRS